MARARWARGNDCWRNDVGLLMGGGVVHDVLFLEYSISALVMGVAGLEMGSLG